MNSEELWLFDSTALANTPSRKDGISAQLEDRYRREGVRIIMDVGGELKLLPNPTIATAAVYFHRFYMFHSFKEFPKPLTALGCLFLAGKVEETPKKCKDLVNIARLKLGSDFLLLGKNPMEEVMAIERVLLQTVKFDVHVDHPYGYLLQYAKIFKVEKTKMKDIVQNTWAFVNDSMYTTLCLQWEPEVVAISLMYMAFKMANLENENAPDWHDRNPGDQWWDQFVSNLTPDMMEEVCHKVLDYYTASSADNGMPSSTISPFEMNGKLFGANASPVPSGPMRSLSTPTTPARTAIRQPEVKPSFSLGHPV